MKNLFEIFQPNGFTSIENSLFRRVKELEEENKKLKQKIEEFNCLPKT